MNGETRKEMGARQRGFAADVIPGLTTAAVVVPKALAYATIAQLPVQAGLFAALVPMAVYAVLGSSRLLSVSTTTPIAILCATAIGEALRSDPGLDPLTASATLSVLVGVMLIARARRSTWVHRQFHFGTGADGIQGRSWLRDRRRPVAQGPRHPHP